MVADGRALRRGLPRTPGGEPWPPAGSVPTATVDAEALPAAATTTASADAAAPAPSSLAGGAPVRAEKVAPAPTDAAAAPPAEATASHQAAAGGAAAADRAAGDSSAGRTMRRGLPRVVGGEPWPPLTTAAHAPAQTAPAPSATAAGEAKPSVARAADGVALRRGLPRTTGGDPWPPEGTVAASPAPAPTAVESTQAAAPGIDAAADIDAALAVHSAPGTGVAPLAPAASRTAVDAPSAGPRPPLTVPRTVWPGRAATHRPVARPEPARVGPFTRAQWAGIVVVGGAGILIAAALAVLLVRFVLSLEPLRDFLATYPGEYHLPEGAPVGFPAWLGWQHFFNALLMLLIIRTGLQIRTEKRPTVFWTPRGDKKGKTSLTIWFHQALDVLWMANGLIFVVLLLVTGQWMRIVPTSWEVLPNAVSAVLQYISLDWPTENGWVNYNALQQLAYFATVFVAAPLAIATGVRMSGVWPKKNERLNRLYPIDLARRIHFPVMLYFVAFIAVHVALVLATGALRNLNHMYAAQGSTDPTAYADNWTGFWMFVLSLAVMAGAWIAARPLVVAPIARLFGTVSGR
jgi:thiosulfate reductase cytochrome b subunit